MRRTPDLVQGTGGNDRFHTYTFQQRIGVLVDWFRVLRADQRDDRFWAWGIINDPACCKPGDPDCPAKSLDETFGFDWCPGDDVLLKYVGKSGYVDPACGLKDAALDADDPHSQGGKLDQRHSPATSSSAPRPVPSASASSPTRASTPPSGKQLNGSMATWAGFAAAKAPKTGIESDQRVSKLADASVEPPFLIGTSCGSCHIAFDPLNPPADPAHPKWENIKGLVGNQYTRMSELLGSGMPKTSLEYQMFAHARPGVTDTSAISHDQINNPGTINAFVNVAQRPVFKGEMVTKWRKTATCGAEKDEGQVLVRARPQRQVLAEEHARRRHDDRFPRRPEGRAARRPSHPEGRRGFDRRPGSHPARLFQHRLVFRAVLGQPLRRHAPGRPGAARLRPDAVQHRPVPARLPELPGGRGPPAEPARFLRLRRIRPDRPRTPPARQRKATNPAATYGRPSSIADLDKEFGKGAVGRGQAVFADNCARCHSSIPESAGGAFANRDFAAPNEEHPRKVRADFLGNDQPTPVTEVGTFRCRALH
jgi:hypothetical protein